MLTLRVNRVYVLFNGNVITFFVKKVIFIKLIREFNFFFLC